MRADDLEIRYASASALLTPSWRGAAALGLLGINAVLQFFPPIPPLWKGSLWSYILAYAAGAAGVAEAARLASSLPGW